MSIRKRPPKIARPGRITVCLGEDLRSQVEAVSGDDKPSTWIRKLIARYFRGEIAEAARDSQRLTG